MSMPQGHISDSDTVQMSALLTRVQINDGQGSWDMGTNVVHQATISRQLGKLGIEVADGTSGELIASGPLLPNKTTLLPGGMVMLVLPHPSGDTDQVFAAKLESQDYTRLQTILQAQLDPPQQAPTLGRVSASETAGRPAKSSTANIFSAKTEQGSADLYFRYYGALQHQQNMLQDYVRTATYHQAITDNEADFRDKLIMDVGAGTGILSLFAAQAGAARVYAVEASAMAGYAEALAQANPGLGERLQVVEGKVEEVQGLPQVDVLVSEPMGTLLVNERMLETYLYARDHFLKPGGRMFPNLGRVHVAAFSDEALHAEIVTKSNFWLETNYFGIDLSSLHSAASAGYFQQVVVDAIPPQCLVSACATREFDFQTIKEEDLHDFTVPLDLPVGCPCYVHGVACWFDVAFVGSTIERWLSTAPGYPTTHWFQLRCVLMQPLLLAAGQAVRGSLRCTAHNQQSYDLHLTLTAPPLTPGGPPQQASGKLDLKEPYYRQLTQWPAEAQAWAAHTAADGVAEGVVDEGVFADAAQDDANAAGQAAAEASGNAGRPSFLF